MQSYPKPALRSEAPFIALFVFLYGAFGVASPFLPAMIETRGIRSEAIGLLFGAGTAIRLLSAPLATRVADQFGAHRLVLGSCAVGAALGALLYLPAITFGPLLGVMLLHSIALAPTTNLADALAVVAARRDHFEYGWVRGAGSAAFIATSLAAGWVIARSTIDVIAPLQAGLMLAVAAAVTCVPPIEAGSGTTQTSPAHVMALLRIPEFQRIVVVAALVLGSHALHDTFSVIRWRAAGISPQTISALWSLAVAAEVVVFFLVGPWLLNRISPAQALGVAAFAGTGRWLVAAATTDPLVLSLIQPLHGITFALLHLASMRILARTVPNALAGTAQSLYGTVGVGAASALTTILSGWLYARLGGGAFLVMSAMCLVALPVVFTLGSADRANRDFSC